MRRLFFVVFTIVFLSLFVTRSSTAQISDSPKGVGCYSGGQTAVTYFDECCCYSCAYSGPGCTYCAIEDGGGGGGACYTSGSSCMPESLMEQWLRDHGLLF